VGRGIIGLVNRTGASEETRKGRGRAASSTTTATKGRARPKPPTRDGANGQANGHDEVSMVKARPSRAERASAEERMRRIDDVCAAWAAIVAERMAADQQFTDLYEAYRTRSADLRGLFAWDALHAAEAHLALVNSALARHIGDDGRADPRAILADLRWEQRKPRLWNTFCTSSSCSIRSMSASTSAAASSDSSTTDCGMYSDSAEIGVMPRPRCRPAACRSSGTSSAPRARARPCRWCPRRSPRGRDRSARARGLVLVEPSG
jgi:hypothetical protein